MFEQAAMFFVGALLGILISLYFFSTCLWFPNKVNENMARTRNGEHQYAEYCNDPYYLEDNK